MHSFKQYMQRREWHGETARILECGCDSPTFHREILDGKECVDGPSRLPSAGHGDQKLRSRPASSAVVYKLRPLMW